MSEAAPSQEPLGRGDLQRRAVRGAMWTGAHTLLSMPLAFVVNIVLARVLGVEGYGRLAYLTTIITIATVIAGMGVTTALIQFGSKAHAAGRADVVTRYLSGAQGFRLLVMGPLVALAVVGTVKVDLWLLIVALMFGVAAPALLGTANDALTIENRTDRGAQIAIIVNLVTQISVVVAVLTLGTADAVWSTRVVVGGLLLALPLASIARVYRGAVLRPRAPWALPKSFWLFALPTGVSGMLAALTSNRIEVILLDWFSDPAAMGVFGLAFGLAGHVYAPAQALIGPLIPAISGLTEVDRSAVRLAFLRTSRVSSAIGGLLVATALPALAVLVPLVYGQEFASASDHVIALGAAGAIALIGSPHGAFLMARLGGRRMLWISVAVLVTNLVLGLTLIPLIGVWGATVACGSAMIVRVALVSTGEARALSVDHGQLFRHLGSMPVGIVVAVASWLAVRTVDQPAVAVALLISASCLAAHLLTTWTLGLGLSGDDVNAMSAALPMQFRPAAKATLGLVAHFRERGLGSPQK